MSGMLELARTTEGQNRNPGIQPYELQRGRRYISVPVDFDLKVVRVRGGVEAAVTQFVEGVDWSDSGEGAAGGMTGSIAARRPRPLDPRSLPLAQGDRIAVRYRDAFSRSPWKEEVQMQIASPSTDPGSGAVGFTLASPFVAFQNVQRMFIYRKDKHHPDGWKMHQMIKSACASCGAPYGHIARGYATFPSTFKGDALGADRKHTPRSPLLAFVLKCIEYEKKETGRQLAVAITNGALEVVERGASGAAYVLDTSAQEMSIEEEAAVRPPTAIRAFGRIGKGKDSETVSVVVTAPRAIEKFGFILREEHLGQVRSRADLRDQAKRILANGSKDAGLGLRRRRTATVTVPGLPGVRPYDAVILASPKDDRGVPAYQDGFSTRDFGRLVGTPDQVINDRLVGTGMAYISSRSHSISGGVWTTTLSLQERDPWVKYRQQLAERKVGYRERKAKSPKPKSDTQSNPGAG